MGHFPHQPTECQEAACRELAEFLYDGDPYAAFLLKGYAGTGKTSLVSALIQSAPGMKIKTVLLAPTGRAAKVLSNYSGKKAYTIHKKIYTTVTDASGGIHFGLSANKHSHTLFIVDEASMIGVEDFATGHSLLEDLIDYVTGGKHCRLLLVGDVAQLPPVGQRESPALDRTYLSSISPLKVREATLDEVVRQQQESGILHNATLLRDRIETMEEGEVVEGRLFELAGFEDIKTMSGEELTDSMNGEYGEWGEEGVVLITRSNKRANLYNQGIRNRVLFREEEVNAGDLLMVVKNNYYWLDAESEMGFIANGDVVEIQSARNYEELYGFRFIDATVRFVDYEEGQTVDCKLLLDTLHSESPSLTREESMKLWNAVAADYADITPKSERLRAIRNNPYLNALQVKFAYSLTCHKTQGGQWHTVYVEEGYVEEGGKDREWLRWLYTALTRATDKVYLLNFEEGLLEDKD